MLTSWYVAFAMSYLHLDNVAQTLAVYGAVLVPMIAISLLVEQKLRKTRHSD